MKNLKWKSVNKNWHKAETDLLVLDCYRLGNTSVAKWKIQASIRRNAATQRTTPRLYHNLCLAQKHAEKLGKELLLDYYKVIKDELKNLEIGEIYIG
ncbi:MAG: hypothetical protein JSW11_00485 [Candidatus Heimdallarchaeota archaeon]|nr:MAG: hypothetical protein JSW11_00485 [Candidatus Heimdallarchaeota archaeon]